MKQLAFLSGKGGTGKTSLVASFAHLSRPAIAVDCDVDAANLGLLLAGLDGRAHEFESGQRAVIDTSRCDGCGACLDACRFDALTRHEDGTLQVEALACEGCEACALVCPTNAVGFEGNVAGRWWVRKTSSGVLVHAALGIAQDNSGKLVACVREVAREQATAAGRDLILIDGPPGIGCPVHAALTSADAMIAVVEPTVSAEHDLERLLELARRFRCRAWVVLNKSNLSLAGAERIRALCERRAVPLLAEIPFDPAIPHLLARGRLPIVAGGAVAQAIAQAHGRTAELLDGG